MARRRISASQLRSKLRQIEQKQRSAINKYNQEARKYNQGLKRAINKYNQDVRAHNSRVRSQRLRIQSEIRKLQSRHTVTSTVTIRTSAIRLYESYGRLEQWNSRLGGEVWSCDASFNQATRWRRNTVFSRNRNGGWQPLSEHSERSVSRVVSAPPKSDICPWRSSGVVKQ